MKNRMLKCWCLLIGFALSLALAQNRASAQNCAISFPNGNTLTSFIDVYPNYPNSDAYFNTIVSNTAPIPDGTYLTWCVDANTLIDPSQGYTVPGTVYTGYLLPTCASNLNSLLPAGHPASCYVAPAVWQEVNYILNHQNGAYFWDVQVAINNLVGGPPQGPSPPYPPFDTNVVNSLLSAASSNATSWVPGCGSVVGAIYVITNQAGVGLTNPVQLLMLEIPVCPITFTVTPANTNLGCNPATIPDCVNPVNTNLVNAVSCCSHPVTISCSDSTSSVGCKYTRYLTYTATDGFGNMATYVQTITWTVDTTAPVITTVPTGTNVTTLPTDASIAALVAATDSCSGIKSTNVSHVDTTNSCMITRTFTITVTDNCGNTSLPKTVVYTTGSNNASICGIVFRDCNGDGILTPGVDAGDSNVLVTLKNGSGTSLATTLTDSNGNYCFYNLAPGTYMVCINAPTNCTQTAGCHIAHWSDSSGRDCWVENDGYQHCKVSGGNDCWVASDGCQHYKNTNGLDCWTDTKGVCHSQPCTYVGCNIPKGNCETYTLSACENKTGVNFAYQGQAPKVSCTVTGPSQGTCGQTLNYNCTVSNTGNSCFNTCQVVCCGKSYTCPALQPGQCCSIPVSYTCKYSDYGNFNCQATITCANAGTGTPCTTQGNCYTQLAW